MGEIYSKLLKFRRFNSIFEEVHRAYKEKYRNSREIYFARVNLEEVKPYIQDIKVF